MMSEKINIPSDLVKTFKTYHDTWRRVEPILSRVFVNERLGILYNVMKLVSCKPLYLCEHGIARCVEFSLGGCTVYVDLPASPEYIPPDVANEIEKLPRIVGRPWDQGVVLDTGFGAYVHIIGVNSPYGYESEIVEGEGIRAKQFVYTIRVIETNNSGFRLNISIRSLTSPTEFRASLQLFTKNDTLVYQFVPDQPKDIKKVALLAITDFFSKNKEEMKNALKCGTELLTKLELPSTIYLLY
jgi:hypothetical protein